MKKLLLLFVLLHILVSCNIIKDKNDVNNKIFTEITYDDYYDFDNSYIFYEQDNQLHIIDHFDEAIKTIDLLDFINDGESISKIKEGYNPSSYQKFTLSNIINNSYHSDLKYSVNKLYYRISNSVDPHNYDRNTKVVAILECDLENVKCKRRELPNDNIGGQDIILYNNLNNDSSFIEIYNIIRNESYLYHLTESSKLKALMRI